MNTGFPRWARPVGRRAAWLALAIQVAVAGAGLPRVALASAADESKAAAAKGAGLFKKADYFGAAQAFEKAFALDARDFRVLRYAGRAWQEVGHWDRALTLLERYQSLETDPELKASVQANIDLLRKATPREKAERLEKAIQAYPQARLEEDAAAALEALDDAPAYRRALQLYEVARVAATTAADKARLDKEIKRVRELVKVAEARKVAAPEEPKTGPAVTLAAPATPAEAAGISTLQWAAWGGGAALLAGGAALWAVGASDSRAAADAMARANALPAGDASRAGKVSAARSDYATAGAMYYTGVGLVAVGAAAAAAGFWLGPSAKVAVLPTPSGAAVALRF
ncbi:MAG: hypothetical protein HY902_08940 [Deltaproteobacteria bacterium]|nr:hypothetical protein [Deltaproteobacteria bacterium]